MGIMRSVLDKGASPAPMRARLSLRTAETLTKETPTCRRTFHCRSRRVRSSGSPPERSRENGTFQRPRKRRKEEAEEERQAETGHPRRLASQPSAGAAGQVRSARRVTGSLGRTLSPGRRAPSLMFTLPHSYPVVRVYRLPGLSVSLRLPPVLASSHGLSGQ